jgi:hypothetical protein
MHATAPSPTAQAAEEIAQEAKDGARAASPWIEGLGRFGYAAKGVVYLIVGALAIQAALGQGGTTTDNQGALAHIASAPFGRSILVILTVGLIGYAIWRLVQGLLDTEHKGTDLAGLATRAMFAGVSIIYVGLAYSAMRLVLGAEAPAGSTRETQDWTAWLMGQPFGSWLVALGGLLVIGNGLMQLYRAFAGDLCKPLDCSAMSATQKEWIERIGRAGYAARGIAFATIGTLLIFAAMHSNPAEAQGLDGALATLAAQRYGSSLLGLVAAGLAAYGIFALVEARHRRMVIV